MSHLHAATPDQGTVRPDERLDEEFWAIVCADDEWLRAEFEAIVNPGHPGRRGGEGLPPTPPRRPHLPSDDGPPTGPPVLRGSPGATVRLPARQRSPPRGASQRRSTDDRR